jgi:hypothetical protein
MKLLKNLEAVNNAPSGNYRDELRQQRNKDVAAKHLAILQSKYARESNRRQSPDQIQKWYDNKQSQPRGIQLSKKLLENNRSRAQTKQPFDLNDTSANPLPDITQSVGSAEGSRP